MKRLLYALLLVLPVFAGLAQPLTLSSSSININGDATATLSAETHLTNNTANTLSITWHRSVVSMPVGWTTTVCDTNNCYAAGTSSQVFTLLAGHSGFLTLNVFPNNIMGTGVVNIDSYDASDSANTSARATYNINVNSLGVATIAQVKEIYLYPNPAHNELNITLDESVNPSSLDVYNLLGLRVASLPVAGGSQIYTMNLSNLAKGMYFLRVTTAAGKVITKSFSKN